MAVFQLIALPFMLLNGNSKLFFAVILLITIPWLTVALLAVKNRHLRLPKLKLTKPTAIFLIVIVGILAQSIFFQRYDIDDSFYLGLASDSTISSALYSYDPATGVETFPMPSIYTMGSFELFISLVSYISHLSVASVAHIVFAILVILSSIFAYKLLFEELLGSVRKSYLAASIFTLVLGFTGLSGYLSGNFILARSWQGKALLIGIFMPMFLTLCIKFFAFVSNRTYKTRELYFYLLAIAIIELAAFASSPVSTYLLPPLLLMALVANMKNFNFRDIKKLGPLSAIIMLPIMLFALGIFLLSSNSAAIEEVKNTTITFDIWRDIAKSLFVSKAYLVLTLLSLVFLISQNQYKKVRFFALGITIVGTLMLNPLIAEPLAHLVTTSATYWRLFWLVFPEAVISLAIYILIELAMSSRIDRFKRLSYFGGAVSSFIVVIFIGGYLFSTKSNFTPITNLHKIPDIAVSASKLPDGSVVFADQLTSSYVRSVNPRITVAYSRPFAMKYFFTTPDKSEELEKLDDIYRAINGVKIVDDSFYNQLQGIGVNYIVFSTQNTSLNSYTAANPHFKTVDSNKEFVIQQLVEKP
jgi:hypothetical protein